ncbi:MAG: PAS domain S-box protein, partial [Halobacteriaceae archaeon]
MADSRAHSPVVVFVGGDERARDAIDRGTDGLVDVRREPHPSSEEGIAVDPDVIVVDGRTVDVDGIDTVKTTFDGRDSVPTVYLATEEYETIAPSALAAGATSVLPRTVLADRPGLLVDRATSGEPTAEGSTETSTVGDLQGELFESVSDGLVVHDPATGEIQAVNQRYCELTGYDRETLIGSTIDIITADGTTDSVDRALGYIDRAREAGPQLFEFEAERKDGDRFVGEVHLRTLVVGDEERVLASVRDVTDRVWRERAIHRLQEFTARLQTTDSRDEVASSAVEAVGEVLDLPVAACWFRSEAGDRLEPVAATAAARDRDLLSPLATDRPEFDAFLSGEVTTYDPHRVNPDNPLETAVLLPLGDHGLIAAGRPSSAEYDEVTLDVARTFADHTTTALDRIEREREVHERDRRFRLIADRLDQVIFLSKPDFSEAYYLNDAYEDIWGEPASEALDDPRRFLEGVHPDDRDRLASAIDSMLEDIESGTASERYDFEYRVERSPEDVRWVRASGYPVIEDTDEPLFVGLVEDVTERRELRTTYRSVFENVSDGLVIHHPETGEIVDVNERFCQMNGYERDDLIGASVDVVTGPNHSYEAAKDRIIKARSGDTQLFEWTNQRQDGTTFPVEVHLTTIEYRGAERVLGSVRDVSARKRRKREYEQLFDGVSDAITVHDPDTLAITDVNEAACSVTGYDRESLLTGGIELITATGTGSSTDRVTAEIASVVDTGEEREFEWGIETATGDHRWLQVKATKTTIGGTDRIVTIGRDVTDRRRSERRLAAVLDRIDEAVFMTRVHEITEASRAPDYVSSGYERIWGQSLETIRETYESGFFGTLHPEDEPEYRSTVAGIVADVEANDAAERYTHEYRIQTPDEAVRWVESEFYPIEWERGSDRIVIVSRDVTERKHRERRLVSFEDATDDLTRADTPTEAAIETVEAAEETLGLDAVGVFLYDSNEGALLPEVRSAALPESIGADPVGPNDGPVWAALARDTVVAPEDVGGAGSYDALEDWRCIPLSNHGVLFVGSGRSRLAQDTLESALVVAATLEAALNHIKGQRQLADREAALTTEARRAERLDRIARLARQVEAAITQSASKTAVEREVCERLVDTGSFSMAWIGGVAGGTDRIEARTIVGESEGYVDALDLLTTEAPSASHPAVGAWTGGEVRVEQDIVATGSPGEWRQHVLAAGLQSLCAVPLTHDGVTHGVLCIGGGSPNTFDERAIDVLSQLGTSIAHAFAGIERRRALETDETVEIRLEADTPAFDFGTVAAATGSTVRHERTVRREDGDVGVHFAIEGDVPDDVEAILASRFDGTVDVVREDEEGLSIEVREETWFGAPLSKQGGVLRRAIATPDGTELAVELPRGSDVRALVDRLTEVEPSLDLAGKRHLHRAERTSAEIRNEIESSLTDRQYEVLRTAY